MNIAKMQKFDQERNDLPDEMAKAAANWWAQRCCGTIHHDNGDKEFSGIFAGLLADRLMEPANDRDLQKFEDALIKRLTHCERYEYVHLDCDYAPCKILNEAALEAGVSPHNFPWKTSMRIDPQNCSIIVSEGYRAPWVTIFKKEEP